MRLFWMIVMAAALAGCILDDHPAQNETDPPNDVPDESDVVSWHGDPLPERLTLQAALERVTGNISWAQAVLENGTATQWDIGTVEGTKLTSWRLYGAGLRVPRLPLPDTYYPDGYILERSEGEGAVPSTAAARIPEPGGMGKVWWDANNGWATGRSGGWNATWGDSSSGDVLRDAPGPVVSLHGNEREAGFEDGQIVPPDPDCGDGRVVRWNVEVSERGGIGSYAFQAGSFHALGWREGGGEGVQWLDSAEIDWPAWCFSYRTTMGQGPTWEGTHLSSDTALTMKFDGMTGERR